jgi:hypothetical protein
MSVLCNAFLKAKEAPCGLEVVPGKNKCRAHGGMSTGPRTAEGRARIAAAKTVHGQETSALRQLRSKICFELRLIEDEMFSVGLIRGSRRRGRKPSMWAREGPIPFYSQECR